MSTCSLTGWTALHEAAFVGDNAVAEELLKAGADVNARSDDGVSPLHDAVCGGHYQVRKKVECSFWSHVPHRGTKSKHQSLTRFCSHWHSSNLALGERIEQLMKLFLFLCLPLFSFFSSGINRLDWLLFQQCLDRTDWHYSLCPKQRQSHLDHLVLGWMLSQFCYTAYCISCGFKWCQSLSFLIIRTAAIYHPASINQKSVFLPKSYRRF